MQTANNTETLQPAPGDSSAPVAEPRGARAELSGEAFAPPHGEESRAVNNTANMRNESLAAILGLDLPNLQILNKGTTVAESAQSTMFGLSDAQSGVGRGISSHAADRDKYSRDSGTQRVTGHRIPTPDSAHYWRQPETRTGATGHGTNHAGDHAQGSTQADAATGHGINNAADTAQTSRSDKQPGVVGHGIANSSDSSQQLIDNKAKANLDTSPTYSFEQFPEVASMLAAKGKPSSSLDEMWPVSPLHHALTTSISYRDGQTVNLPGDAVLFNTPGDPKHAQSLAITVQPGRPPVTEGINIAQDGTITTWGSGDFAFRHLGNRMIVQTPSGATINLVDGVITQTVIGNQVSNLYRLKR